MTNAQKAELRELVIQAHKSRLDVATTIRKLTPYGFAAGTIRKYYKTFAP